MRTAAYKVPDGKLLKIRLEITNDVIRRVIIMGDFFMHPEDALPKLESRLAGLPLDKSLLTKEIDKFLVENSITLIGAKAQDIAHVILMAE